MSITRSIAPKAPATSAAALVLWGHGCAGGPGVLETHAARLRELDRFSQVRTACLRGNPCLAEAMAELTTERVYLVPMLMADGFLARTALGGAIAALACRERLRVAPVLGANPRLAELLRAEGLAAATARGWAPEAATLLLVGHGTPRDANSRATAFAHAAAIERRGGFGRVTAAFLEDRPSVAEAAGADAPLVAVGLFADAGPHGADDADRALAALGRPYACAGAIGRAPEIADLVLEQVALADRLARAA